MSIHHEGISCSDLGRVIVFNDSLVRLVQVKAGETEAVHEQTLAGGLSRTSTRYSADIESTK